ncbi:sporulation histidine kinase inhibitor Sda [Virgibacillus sp. NKC19-3]|nr:sporulation histidine kinase inhibitor Sda [Virgibacillus sp. NKC19-3]MBY7141560.1 sporulation histidine kinase inhibitor Sda [Virgibacillus sp. NKC19-3]
MISNELLIEAYFEAKSLELDFEFIELLKTELRKRCIEIEK